MVIEKHKWWKYYLRRYSNMLRKKNEKYAFHENKRQKRVVFELEDWVWIYIRQVRFLTQKRFKLISRGDKPFQIIEKINDNASKVELSGEYGISVIFNLSNLYLFDVGDDSRKKSFEKRGNDAILLL